MVVLSVKKSVGANILIRWSDGESMVQLIVERFTNLKFMFSSSAVRGHHLLLGAYLFPFHDRTDRNVSP